MPTIPISKNFFINQPCIKISPTDCYKYQFFALKYFALFSSPKWNSTQSIRLLYLSKNNYQDLFGSIFAQLLDTDKRFFSTSFPPESKHFIVRNETKCANVCSFVYISFMCVYIYVIYISVARLLLLRVDFIWVYLFVNIFYNFGTNYFVFILLAT